MEKRVMPPLARYCNPLEMEGIFGAGDSHDQKGKSLFNP